MSASSSAEGWQLDAADLPAAPRTYVQQSFTSYYAIDMEGAQGNDLALRLHPNGLCGERPSAAAAAAAGSVHHQLALLLACDDLACSVSQWLSHQPRNISNRRFPRAVVTLAPSHAALVADSTEAAAAGGPAAEPAATDAQQPAAGSTHQEPRAGQQTAAPTAAAPQAAEAQLALSPKLLQAEFRKGRGPLLQSDTILGRWAPGSSQPCACVLMG